MAVKRKTDDVAGLGSNVANVAIGNTTMQLTLGEKASSTLTVFRPWKKRRVDPQIVAALVAKVFCFPEEPFVCKFMDHIGNEDASKEFKATMYQDYAHFWKLLKAELPRNIVACYNTGSTDATYEILFGVSDGGIVFGVWLSACQRHRLAEATTSLLRSKLTKMVVLGEHYDLAFMRVNPASCATQWEDRRLYVVAFSIKAQKPSTPYDFCAVRRSEDNPGVPVVFLRVGCAQVQRLNKERLAELVAIRTKLQERTEKERVIKVPALSTLPSRPTVAIRTSRFLSSQYTTSSVTTTTTST